MTKEPGRLQSMGLLESDMTERLHFHFSLSCIGPSLSIPSALYFSEQLYICPNQKPENYLQHLHLTPQGSAFQQSLERNKVFQ